MKPIAILILCLIAACVAFGQTETLTNLATGQIFMVPIPTNTTPLPPWILLSWTPVKHYSLTCAKLTKPSALLMTHSQTNYPTQIYNQIYESTDLLNWQFYEACPDSVTNMLVPNLGLPIQVFKFGISYRGPID
jgi:hypothetical protein